MSDRPGPRPADSPGHQEVGQDDQQGHPKQKEQRRERYEELLDELRTIIPGVQVLLAFLLTVPFSSRFNKLDPTGTRVFTLTLVLTTAATVVLLAPTAYHRLVPTRDRRSRLDLGQRLTGAGLMLLGAAIVCGIWVVVRFIFNSNAWAHGIAGGALALTASLWVGLPLRKRPPQGS